MATTTTKRQIDDFLALKRLALVGVSRDPKEFSFGVWQELRRRGYDVVPVNPKTTELDGQRCYAQVQDIQPPVQGAIVMTAPRVTEHVVADCADAGIRHVWLHRGGGVGAVSTKAVTFCASHDIDVVAGQCPYMFLPGTPVFHGIHGFVRKVTGNYPK